MMLAAATMFIALKTLGDLRHRTAIYPKVTATIARTDPSDRGFTGTLVGLIGADHVDGTMNVSLAEADAIRTATFALSPDAAPPPPR